MEKNDTFVYESDVFTVKAFCSSNCIERNTLEKAFDSCIDSSDKSGKIYIINREHGGLCDIEFATHVIVL